jgi:hypothetical protein
MPAGRLSEQQWREFHERALNGESTISMGKEVGYSTGAITTGLKRRFGYKPHPRRTPLTEEQCAAIHERVLRGEGVPSVAREMGIDPDPLYLMLMNKYGLRAKDARLRPVWDSAHKLDRASKTDLAYIAAIVDGEGSILHLSPGRQSPFWVVKVGMTDRPVIEWLHKFGGTFNVTPSKRGHKTIYGWNVSRQLDVQALLTAVLPYLKVKRARAREALVELDTLVARASS